MGELTIRTDSRIPSVRNQAASKGEKTAGSSAGQRAARTAFTVSESLQQLMNTDSRAVRQLKESFRALQNGESALDELKDSLDSLAELAGRAAGGGAADRQALQTELDGLLEKLERILSAGIPLLPGSGADMGSGDRLAVLYLGAIIAGGGTPPETISPERALEGLKQLLEKVADGVSPDQAVALLSNGRYAGLADFQAQFAGGDIPGMQALLESLLSPGGLTPALPDLSALFLLMELGGTDRELMSQLVTVLDGLRGQTAQSAAGEGQQSPPVSVMRAGEFQAAGKDLSGVSFEEPAGRLVVSGTQDVAIRGTGREGSAIALSGSGTVTFRDVRTASLTAHSPASRIFAAGETTVEELRLGEKAVLTVDGHGPLRVGAFRAENGSLLRLAEGAAVMPMRGEAALPGLTAPVILEGPASLAAAARVVRSAEGTALESFDVVWETLLPGWNSITSVAVDGRQARLALLRGDPVRLWLAKGDPSHGYDIHDLAFQGQDESGRPQTRYAYLLWNRQREAFEEISLCTNPFSVTGGEPGRDWVYEEESRTLHILSSQVTAISGGSGTQEGQTPFSGRIALADGIGAIRLTLEGVICRAAAGSAFSLGRENDVTLLLKDGTDSRFEGGPGCAGISLGDGACLRLDRAALKEDGRGADGSLTAAGGRGGAGIGRDGGGSRDRSSRILILGGSITAAGGDSAAGIGAGQHSAIGMITIAGGTVVSTGGTGGGAGIGGALDAPAGDIQIRGGKITAEAAGHAAAIGSGVQGACGDILITGTARIIKAQNIGACPLGGCGRVLVSGGADIGTARVWSQTDITEGQNEETAPLPCLTLEGLGLDRLRVQTLEEAYRAKPVIDKALRRIAALRRIYGDMYSRMERGCDPATWGPAGELVRDTGAAGKLLGDLKRAAPQALRAHGRPENAGEILSR